MKVILSGAAGRDLDDIFDFTLAEWDAAQAASYVASFEQVFGRLSEHPRLGVTTDARRGYRRLGHRQHLIYYRILADAVEIVRILHQRMDPSRHLR